MSMLTNIVSQTRYELPESGISLLGYVVRRMHKTRLLVPLADLLSEGNTAEALSAVTLYLACASISFGPAYYQPMFNSAGSAIHEADPETGFMVTARLTATQPHLRIEYQVEMPGIATLTGVETVLGTTIGLGGLGMPAPSKAELVSQDGTYQAEISGLITSELQPGFLRSSRIRGFGELKGSDSAGNKSEVRVDRQGKITLKQFGRSGQTIEKTLLMLTSSVAATH
jgi:hypothetical protein